jgi:hypothetical protein
LMNSKKLQNVKFKVQQLFYKFFCLLCIELTCVVMSVFAYGVGEAGRCFRWCFCGLAPELQGEPATREHYNFSGEKPGWYSKTPKKAPRNRRRGHIAILFPAQIRQGFQYRPND